MMVNLGPAFRNLIVNTMHVVKIEHVDYRKEDDDRDRGEISIKTTDGWDIDYHSDVHGGEFSKVFAELNHLFGVHDVSEIIP